MKVTETKTALEFIDCFRPYLPEWQHGTWIFRGQRKSGWDIIPTIFRPPAEIGEYFEKSFQKFRDHLPYLLEEKSSKISLGNLYGERENFRQCITLYNFEKYLQYLFVKNANNLGFVVHNSEPILNLKQIFDSNLNAAFNAETGLSNEDEVNLNANDHPEIYVCQAQHHGIPTRLLDFTVNSYAALFFASGVSDNDEVDEIAVFATNLDSFRLVRHYIGMQMYNKDLVSGLYSVFRMPNSYNDYLHKQGGLFLYPKFPYKFYLKHNRFPTLKDHFDIFAGYSSFNGLQKFTLPGSEKPALREALKRMGVTKSSLMPTFDNVVMDIKNDLLTGENFY